MPIRIKDGHCSIGIRSILLKIRAFQYKDLSRQYTFSPLTHACVFSFYPSKAIVVFL